jgi:uncharacterized membrane protein
MLPALLAQIATLLFHQTTTNLDLYPFNNVRGYSRRERLLESAVNGVVMLLPIGLLLVDRTATVVASAVVLTVLFCLELAMWWLPYATGRAVPALTQGDEPWSVVHERLFAETVTVLPQVRDHPTPNLEHTVLHAMTAVAALLTWMHAVG